MAADVFPGGVERSDIIIPIAQAAGKSGGALEGLFLFAGLHHEVQVVVVIHAFAQPLEPDGSHWSFVAMGLSMRGIDEEAIAIVDVAIRVRVGAVVAPGIAEALFATALGLVAAIPAVMAYNKISAELNRYATSMETFSHELHTLVSRKLFGG